MTRLLVLAIALQLSANANAAKIYKYVDSEGNVVYSETKPKDVKDAREIKPKVQSVSPDAARKQLDALGEKADNSRKNRELVAKGEDDRDAVARRKSENCEQARKNLEVLETSPRVQATDSEGKLFYLDDDAVKAKKAEAQSQIAEYCL